MQWMVDKLGRDGLLKFQQKKILTFFCINQIIYRNSNKDNKRVCQYQMEIKIGG